MILEITHNEPNILETLRSLENETISELNQMLSERGETTLHLKYKAPIHFGLVKESANLKGQIRTVIDEYMQERADRIQTNIEAFKEERRQKSIARIAQAQLQ